MTTQELIAELRGHANRMTSAWPNATAAVRAAADMLESQFIAAERDAEAIRQLREDNARLTACLANYHEAESDRIATAEQQEADEERDKASHRCGADVFSSPSSPS